jgi:hypothetical protein
MTPSLLLTIPDPDPLPLPAPGWLLWFLLMLTFLLHLLAMNLVLGGSILGGVSELLARKGGRTDHERLVAWLSKAMPVAVAATITLGVAPLLFVQVLYGRLFFSSSVIMAWPWLAVVPLLILAYYGVYLRAFKGESLGGSAPLVGWLAALIFVVIGFLYSNNMSMMLRPGVLLGKYLEDDRGFTLNLDDPTLFPRYLHFLLGAVAVAGMVVVVLGLLNRRRDAEHAAWAIRYGSLWFAVTTALNMAVGIWWLVALPRETMMRFMGGNGFATALLGLGILLSLAVLLHMAMAAASARPARLATSGAALLALLLVVMVLTRDQVRRGALEAAGFEPVAWVAPQWGPILVFLALLVSALGAVGWMVRALARGTEGAGGE